MILEFTREQLAEAEATPEPRHIWVNGDQVLVYTGEDMPEQPTAEEL